MKVIEIGDILARGGERLCGILVEASRDELRAAARSILYREVTLLPAESDAGPDEAFGRMADALCAVDARVRASKPSKRYTRDEVLAMLDEIDPEPEGKGDTE